MLLDYLEGHDTTLMTSSVSSRLTSVIPLQLTGMT